MYMHMMIEFLIYRAAKSFMEAQAKTSASCKLDPKLLGCANG